MRRVIFTCAFTLAAVCVPTSSSGQGAAEDAIVARTIAHMRSHLPAGRLALDTTVVTRRATIDVALSSNLELTRLEDVVRCQSPMQCTMGAYTGVIGIQSVTSGESEAEVVARGYKLIHKGDRSAFVMEERRICFEKRGGVWVITSSTVTRES